MCLGHAPSAPGSTIIGCLKSERGPGQAHLSTVLTGLPCAICGGKPLLRCLMHRRRDLALAISYRAGVQINKMELWITG